MVPSLTLEVRAGQGAEQRVGVEHGLAGPAHAVAIGRSGPSPTPSRSPSPPPRSPWRRPRRRGRRVSSPAVKLGICSPKRMQPNLPARRSGRAASHQPGEPAQPGQRHRPLGGLEGAKGRQAGRWRPERMRTREAAERGEEDGDRRRGRRPTGGTWQGQQLLGRGSALEHHRRAPTRPGRRPAHPTRAWGQSTNTTPLAARSTLSARTSPCTEWTPRTPPGQPDSSSANRSRCARATRRGPPAAPSVAASSRPSPEHVAEPARPNGVRRRHGLGVRASCSASTRR